MTVQPWDNSSDDTWIRIGRISSKIVFSLADRAIYLLHGECLLKLTAAEIGDGKPGNWRRSSKLFVPDWGSNNTGWWFGTMEDLPVIKRVNQQYCEYIYISIYPLPQMTLDLDTLFRIHPWGQKRLFLTKGRILQKAVF